MVALAEKNAKDRDGKWRLFDAAGPAQACCSAGCAGDPGGCFVKREHF
jgi:hypothetical protein